MLTNQHRLLLFESVHKLIQIYSKNEIGKKRSINNLDEEDLYEDLSLILDILAALISAEYEGFERDTVLARMQKSDLPIDVAEITFVGVNSLLPLITHEMLQFPKLCLDYVHLVGLLIEYFPDRLATLPSTLLESLIQSLLYGTQQFMGRISEYSLKGIQSLGLYCWAQTTLTHDNYLQRSVDLLLTEIMQNTILKPLDTSILDPVAFTVFALGLARPQTLRNLFSSIVSGPRSASLQEAMEKLTNVMNEQLNNQNSKLQQGKVQVGWGAPGLDRLPSLNVYRKMFVSFVMESRSILLVK